MPLVSDKTENLSAPLLRGAHCENRTPPLNKRGLIEKDETFIGVEASLGGALAAYGDDAVASSTRRAETSSGHPRRPLLGRFGTEFTRTVHRMTRRRQATSAYIVSVAVITPKNLFAGEDTMWRAGWWLGARRVATRPQSRARFSTIVLGVYEGSSSLWIRRCRSPFSSYVASIQTRSRARSLRLASCSIATLTYPSVGVSAGPERVCSSIE